MMLVEFLLARIAEDESEASNWSRFEMRDGIPGSYGIKERVLADCEARRWIVERHQACGTGVGYCDDGGHGWGWGGLPLGCADLADLAAVYVDHQDYDKAWRGHADERRARA